MIFIESLILFSILCCVCVFATLKTTNNTKPMPQIDKLDKKLIVALTLFFAIITYFNIGSFNHPNGNWDGKNENQQLTLKLATPAKLQTIYYYSGINNGKYEWAYQTQNGTSGVFDDPTARLGYPAHYKWNKFSVSESQPISQIRLNINTPELVIKQIVLIDNNNKYIPNIALNSSNSDDNLQNIITQDEPSNYKDNFLSSTYFDEIFYATTAYQYINKLNPYVAVHPPLGMLLIGIGIVIFGMSAFGWRFIPALASIALVPLIYIFAKKLFRNRYSAIIATLLLMFDPMHYVMGRIAFLDGIVTFFIVLQYYYLYSYLELRTQGAKLSDCYKAILWIGIALGCGMSCKWSSLYFALPLLLTLLYTEISLAKPTIKEFVQAFLYLFVCLVIVPLSIYGLSYVPFILSQTDTDLFSFIWRIQTYMYEFQAHGLQNATHPYSSFWYQWPTLKNPISLFFWQENSMANSIVFIANPLISFLTFPVMATLIIATITDRTQSRNWFILFALSAQLLPYAFIKHIMFLYYFYSSIPFIILGIVCTINDAFDWKNKLARYVVYTYVAAVIVVFLMFIPALVGIEFPRDYVVHFLLWKNGWNF